MSFVKTAAALAAATLFNNGNLKAAEPQDLRTLAEQTSAKKKLADAKFSTLADGSLQAVITVRFGNKPPSLEEANATAAAYAKALGGKAKATAFLEPSQGVTTKAQGYLGDLTSFKITLTVPAAEAANIAALKQGLSR